MIVIFQCYGGTHTSVVAAALCTGLLSRAFPPDSAAMGCLPFFDRVNSDEVGGLCYMGKDRRGNPVFALGSRGHGAEMRLLMAAFLPLCAAPGPGNPLRPSFGEGEEGEVMPPAGVPSGEGVCPEVAVIDCMPEIPLVTRIGGFLSRRLGMPALGRPLVCLGLRCGIRSLLHLIESFEKDPRPYLLGPGAEERH